MMDHRIGDMILQMAFTLLISSFLAVTPMEVSNCTSNLQNLAVFEGDANILMNLTANPNDTRWSIIPTIEEFEEFGYIMLTDYEGYINPDYVDLFYPNQSGLLVATGTGTKYNGLISTAGLYIAQCKGNSNRTAAKLVVVTQAPSCSCSASSPDSIQLTCQIRYGDHTVYPINANMTWLIDGAVNVTDTPERKRVKYYYYDSISTITVDSSSVSEIFTCSVAFNAPIITVNDLIAPNAPEYSASCSVEVCQFPNTTNVETSIEPVTSEQGPNCSCSKVNASTVQLNCSSNYDDSVFNPINAIFTLNVDGSDLETDTPPRVKGSSDYMYTYFRLQHSRQLSAALQPTNAFRRLANQRKFMTQTLQ